MANKEVSGLTAAAGLTAADLIPISQGGNSRKATGAQMQALASGHPGFIAGNWYYLQRATVAAGVAGQDTIQLTPFVISAPITISDMATRVTTALAANNIQLALYAHNPTTGRPTGAALAVTGSISVASTGNVSADITGANVTLQSGVYWTAVNHSGATSVILSLNTGGTGYSGLGVGSATLGNLVAGSSAGFYVAVAQAFGTWPDLTAASFTESATNLSSGPAIFFKAA